MRTPITTQSTADFSSFFSSGTSSPIAEAISSGNFSTSISSDVLEATSTSVTSEDEISVPVSSVTPASANVSAIAAGDPNVFFCCSNTVFFLFLI